MNRKFITGHWYASAYEQFENQTDDVDFLLKVLRERCGGAARNILDVACGGGRISIPLAQNGHNVVGFDADEFMLLRCYRRMRGIPNISCYQADALQSDWGGGFDVVVLAGNILINIESDIDYTEAQRIFIQKAAKALRPGGHLYLDYDQHSDASAIKFFNRLGESGRLGDNSTYHDELGTSGKIIFYGNMYDPITRICGWVGHRELMTNNGERIIESTRGYKHIPMLKQVYDWLKDAGFTIEKTYRNYTDTELNEQEPDYVRAGIWACKKEA